MGKPKRERVLKSNEAKARTSTIRISPQKLNLLAQLIRGKKAAAALSDLTFSRKRIARDVKRTLKTALANAENNPHLDVDSLLLAEAHVGYSLVLQRSTPRARGRVGSIHKRFSHLTIVVREVEETA